MKNEVVSLLNRFTPTVYASSEPLDFESLDANGYITPGRDDDTIYCCEDGGQVDVVWIDIDDGTIVPYRNCPYCGSKRIDPKNLRTWTVNLPLLLERFAESLGLTSTESIGSVLYRLGRIEGVNLYYLHSLQDSNFRAVQRLLASEVSVLVLISDERVRSYYERLYDFHCVTIESLLPNIAGTSIELNRDALDHAIAELCGNSESPENQFRKSGDYFVVSYRTVSTLLKANNGLRYLQYLLRSAGEQFQVAKFKCLVDGQNPDEMEPLHGEGQATDSQTINEVRKTTAGLLADIAEEESHKEPGWEMIVAELRQELTKNEKYLRDSTGYRKSDGKWQNARLEKERKAVSNSIRDSIKRIADQIPELGTHLTESVQTGTTVGYRPAQPVDWHF